MTGLLIAGSASGVGKTTATLAIAAAMRRRGLKVQLFKGGPDFLDTGHHTRVSGRVARNVDTWMLSPEANLEVLRQASHDADAVIVEGMMGLFDGKDGSTESGSSAEIAKLLRLPVVLVLDAGNSARSLAAVVLGFETFDPELPPAGVILNRVAGEGHFHMLQAAIASRCSTPILGWLAREPAVAIPERHLGLHTAEEAPDGEALDSFVDSLASLAEEHLDIPRIVALQCGLKLDLSLPLPVAAHASVRIGVARDRAFSFYYEDNLDLLRQLGATIVPFSPLQEHALPHDLDALYLGGGYPEIYARELSANHAMIATVRSFAASGRPIYAECGGMIYLSRALTMSDGTNHAMAGVLPFAMEMTDTLIKFGYVTAHLTRDCPLGAAGTSIRGHSFHYSRIVASLINEPPTETSYSVEYSLSGQREPEGFTVGNVLASYIHLHFRAAPEVARHFVQAARAARPAEMAVAQ